MAWEARDDCGYWAWSSGVLTSSPCIGFSSQPRADVYGLIGIRTAAAGRCVTHGPAVRSFPVRSASRSDRRSPTERADLSNSNKSSGRNKRINHAQRSARERSSQPVALKNGGRSARELQRRLGAPAFSVSRLSQNPIVLTCFGICFERKQIPAAGTPPPLRGAARRRCDDASVKVRGQVIAPSRGVTARTASLFVEPRDLHAGIGGSGGGPLHG